MFFPGVRYLIHTQEFVGVINTTDKQFLSMLITNVWLHGMIGYGKQMEMHTSTKKEYISLAREFQKHISDPTRKNGVIDQVNYIKQASQQIGLYVSIMYIKVTN